MKRFSNPWQEQVAAFHRRFGQPVLTTPQMPSADRIALRIRLIREEAQETVEALMAGDIVEAVDGIADLIYVALGTACELGVDMAEVWEEVDRSNKSKSPVLDAGAKITKGPHFVPVNLEPILVSQGWVKK